MNIHYKKMFFEEFLNAYQKDFNSAALFELTLSWLQETKQFMLADEAKVICHCLFEGNALVVAWPLVHFSGALGKSGEIHSLVSFYSTVTEPLYFDGKFGSNSFKTLCNYIYAENIWHKMLLGPLNQSPLNLSPLNKGPVNISPLNEKNCSQSRLSPYNVIQDVFPFQRVFSRAENWYQDEITSFEQYYNQRPSQLKNTARRKEKKLRGQHHIDVKIITELASFKQYFSAYQTIYQQSWKGEESSFAFIENICQQAIEQNKLRMGILLVDGVAAAAQIWFLENKTASIFKLAYDPTYQSFSVGTILSMALSKFVIEDDQVTKIEFGMGNESYKKDWMNKNTQRVTVEVFNSRTMRGIVGAFKYIILAKLKRLLWK
ncbi:MAG: GNAT family N-acetyltransferase [Alteromonadaceae bacterium]|nr:GNAT family N-acetyltransferase [Alteromonadaceae bacterium]